MEISEYQKLAMRTNDGKCTNRLIGTINNCEAIDKFKIDIGGVNNACLGLSGEVGEVNDMIKKWEFHGHTMHLEDLKKELGDILWYVAMMCESFDIPMNEVASGNIEKLMQRYPEGFSEEASRNRKE